MVNRFEIQSNRRMPVYFVPCLVDSLAGESLLVIEQGVALMVNELIDQPEAYDLVWVSAIGFADDAIRLTPVLPCPEVMLPPLKARGHASNLGDALSLCGRQ